MGGGFLSPLGRGRGVRLICGGTFPHGGPRIIQKSLFHSPKEEVAEVGSAGYERKKCLLGGKQKGGKTLSQADKRIKHIREKTSFNWGYWPGKVHRKRRHPRPREKGDDQIKRQSGGGRKKKGPVGH